MIRTNTEMIYDHLVPSLSGLLGEKGTKGRRTELADYLEMISACMSHAGDIFCLNRKDTMHLRIIKMLLAEQAQAHTLKCARV